MNIQLKAFFDPATYTLTYVVFDTDTRDAIVIDPVFDYDPASSKVSHDSIEKVLGFIKENELKLHYSLETHAHADHLAGSYELKQLTPSIKIGIGKNITKVQELFKGVFNLKDLATQGEQFDVLMNEQDTLQAGSIQVRTIFTPGHTPACSSYLIGDRVFTGDALFMPDYGTGRCDFPAGSASDLYQSVHEKLYKLPDTTRVYVGHDYQPGGRELAYETTIAKSKSDNIQLKENTSEADYVKFRTERDATLSAPRLLLPSIQVNIDAGRLPRAEDNGVAYLKMPIRK